MVAGDETVHHSHTVIQKAYQCTHCNVKCRRPQDLRRHLLVHTEASFECSSCGNKFTRHDTLIRHKRDNCRGPAGPGRSASDVNLSKKNESKDGRHTQAMAEAAMAMESLRMSEAERFRNHRSPPMSASPLAPALSPPHYIDPEPVATLPPIRNTQALAGAPQETLEPLGMSAPEPLVIGNMLPPPHWSNYNMMATNTQLSQSAPSYSVPLNTGPTLHLPRLSIGGPQSPPSHAAQVRPIRLDGEHPPNRNQPLEPRPIGLNHPPVPPILDGRRKPGRGLGP